MKSGDLIHADRHGVIVIPYEAAPHLAKLCRRIVQAEMRLLAVVKDRQNFSIEVLTRAFAQFMEEYPVEWPQGV